MNLLTLIALAVVSLTGCVQPSKPDPEELAKITAAITYVKDKQGLCYATIVSQTHNSYKVVSITNVDCERAGL